jgi:ribosome-associated protein
MDSRDLALLAAEACDDRKAVDIRLIRVDEVSSLADWFVICSGLSDVQVRAIARSVEDRLETDASRLPLRREGQSEGRWVLLDYGELIVHVLTPQERSYYDLESFWGHGEQERYLGSRLRSRWAAPARVRLRDAAMAAGVPSLPSSGHPLPGAPGPAAPAGVRPAQPLLVLRTGPPMARQGLWRALLDSLAALLPPGLLVASGSWVLRHRPRPELVIAAATAAVLLPMVLLLRQWLGWRSIHRGW